MKENVFAKCFKKGSILLLGFDTTCKIGRVVFLHSGGRTIMINLPPGPILISKEHDPFVRFLLTHPSSANKDMVGNLCINHY